MILVVCGFLGIKHYTYMYNKLQGRIYDDRYLKEDQSHTVKRRKYEWIEKNESGKLRKKSRLNIFISGVRVRIQNNINFFQKKTDS